METRGITNNAAGGATLQKAADRMLNRMLEGGQTDIEDDALGGRNPENTAKWENVSATRLRSLIERIERLEEERKALSSDIKDIFAEAKSAGFDAKVMRQLLKVRKQEPAEVEEQETLLDVYRRALGM